jgi:Putative bacterial sensory transduction regulator
MAAVDVIDAYVSALPDGGRRLAHAEWGISVTAESMGGEPLDLGLRLAEGLLTARALALPGGGDLDPWMLLWWNRQTRMVRFCSTRSGDIWVHADLPAASIDDVGLDRLLGLVAEAATAVRDYATRARGQAPAPAGGGWLPEG